jgi:hypothetical protein
MAYFKRVYIDEYLTGCNSNQITLWKCWAKDLRKQKRENKVGKKN